MEPVSAKKAMEALKAIGLKAQAPVDPTAFAAPSQRESCDPEDARKRQLTAGFDATPAQRLAWLKEMLALAYRSGALPRKHDGRKK